MTRKFEIHELRSEFIIMLFVDRRPVTTLTGRSKEDLMAVGHSWVDAELQFPCHLDAALRENKQHCLAVKWNGVERRKTLRYA